MPKVNVIRFNEEIDKKYREMGIWGNEIVSDYLDRNGQRFPQKIALIDSKWRLSYSDLARITKRLALRLLELGIRSGDVVAIQGANWAEFPLTHFAVDRIGGVYVPLADGWRHTEIKHLLQITEAKIIIAPKRYRDFDYIAMFQEIKPDLPCLEQIIVLGDDVPSGMLAFNEIINNPLEEKYSSDHLKQSRPSPNQPLYAMVSSGTTALPKIGQWTDNNLIATWLHWLAKIGVKYREDDIAVGIAPINTGSTGYVSPVLAPLLVGATSVLLEKWSEPQEAMELIEKEKATVACMIPTQAIKLLDFNLEKYKVTDFRCLSNAGAAFPFDAAKEVERRLKCKIQTFYGATDGGVPSMTSIDDPDEKRLLTVGRIMPGAEVKIVNNFGQETPQGGEGEVLWRGASKTYGHLGQPELDAEVFTSDGYFQSGDIGIIDREGYLRIVGRKKDMIIRGGQNISPREIEELLYAHPKVADAAVAAVPDPVFGEKACAFVVPKEGESFTFSEMVAFLEEKKIAKWKLPERLELIEEIPKSAGGKVMKRTLTEVVTEKLKKEGK